jgi:hypothetical protein
VIAISGRAWRFLSNRENGRFRAQIPYIHRRIPRHFPFLVGCFAFLRCAPRVLEKKRPSPRKRDHVEPGVAVNCNEKSPKTAHKIKVLGFCHFLRFGAAGVVSTAV